MENRTDLRPDDEGDAQLAGLLREVYAPPAEGAYWDGLEARIMAKIAEHRSSLIPVNWWTDLATWMAPGMAAAALLFVAAGMLWSREKDEDMRSTYEAAVTESVASDMLPGAVQLVTAPHDGSSQREATFRYVLSH